MVYVASTLIQNFKGLYPITLKIQVEKNGRINIVEDTNYYCRPKVWQLLDLLAEIMPKYIHAVGYEVELGTRPVHHLCHLYTSQPCLTFRKEGFAHEKYYLLERTVDANYMCNIPISHLRSLVYWWRLNREEFSNSPWDWEFFPDEN